MSKYVLAYRGGAMADTVEAQQASMAAWGAWFTELGEAAADWGAPFGVSTTVSSTGSAPGSTAALTGYSIVLADSLDAAAALAASCPIIGDGGTVDVYQAVEMG